MSSGLILIFAILIIGGVIATVGDRLGTRVGKARLSLFNLRPRRTATLVTILTGVAVAASTLGILLGFSEPLRTGIFELTTIQRRLRRTKGELETAKNELQAAQTRKAQTEQELNQARSEQAKAKQLLAETNQSLKGVMAERNKANATRVQIQAELSRNQAQLATVSGQVLNLRSDIQRLQTERNRVIAQGERDIQIKNEEIKAKNAVIQEGEARLVKLEALQDSLTAEIERLEQVAEGLRRGNVAIQRGQVLASAVVRLADPSLAQPAVDQLLRETNRAAVQLVFPGSNRQEQIIQITQAEVAQLVRQINTGRDYLVRISSTANYLIGEAPIQVFAEAVPNQLVFQQGALVASTSLDPSLLTDSQIQQRINLLLTSAGFRARRLGILSDTVHIGRVQELIGFIDRLKNYKQSVELQAIAAETTFTAGPLKVEFVALDKGTVILRSHE
jgi:uncharacterized protein (DUF3084 family)